jgi:hypothetical protein
MVLAPKMVPKNSRHPPPPPPLKMGGENHMGQDWLSKSSKVSFGTPLGLLWPPFGLPLAPFWLLWLPFGLPFRSFDLPLVPFWSRNPSGIYTPFRFSPNQGHVRTLPQAHDIYGNDSSIYGAGFASPKTSFLVSKTGLVLVSILDCFLTGFWTPFGSIYAPFWSPWRSLCSSFEGPILDPVLEPIFTCFAPKMVPQKLPGSSNFGGPPPTDFTTVPHF